MFPSTLDRYLLRRAFTPMAAVVISTMVAFLFERLMRSFDLLSRTTQGFQFLTELLVNLLPHYVGLTLPGGFFIGLFVVVSGLNKSSEIDAILAAGMSLGRFATPFVALGVLLMCLSVLLFGFIQPYARYGYHAVLHAAENAGWNGDVRPRALLFAGPDIFLTADRATRDGRHLERVFIRKIGPDGREDILTAASAVVRKNVGQRGVTLELTGGRQISTTKRGQVYGVDFSRSVLELPLAPSKLDRPRGTEVSELTLIELAQRGYGKAEPVLPRQKLLADFYSRLARATILPLLPLLAVPFGLSAKRAGSGSAMLVGALLLFGFETSLILGQGLASAAGIPAALAIGLPVALFVFACLTTWVASRRTPGENPVSWLSEHIAALFAVIAKAIGMRRATRPAR